MRKQRNYWNKKTSFKEALNFNNKRDFKKKYIGAYEFLRKNGLLGMACSHMKRPININKKWTKEKCKEEALKYEKLNEFKKNAERGYRIVKENNWLDEVGSHLKKHKKKIKWTKEKCKEEALKYEHRIDFINKNKNMYAACLRNSWLNEICSHMNKPYTKKIKWTKEKCRNVALKYKHRKEFQKLNTKAYAAAQYNGWLDEICSHMVSIGDRYNKCVYSYEFSDNRVYVGLTYNIGVREKSRKYDKKDAVRMHIHKTGLIPIRKQLTNYISVEKAIKLEKFYLNKYIKEGWLKLNRRKTGGIGSSSRVWNLNRVKKLVSKYDCLDEFIKDDIELYNIAKRSGWIGLLFSN